MLRDAARDLRPAEQLRLWILEVDDRIISGQLFLAAGGEVVYWLGGFDEEYAFLQPALITLLGAIEHAFSKGEKRFDLGGGFHPYKYRFSDGERRFEKVVVILRLSRFPLARIQLVTEWLRVAAASRLSPEIKKRVRSVLRSWH
jgi:CelD/BcsL family acetyltransferase involved in cellulose biosynthesis